MMNTPCSTGLCRFATKTSLLPVLNTTRDPDVLVAWWYLGELYREQGRTDNATAAYDRYLKATEGGNDPQVNKQRDLAAPRLSSDQKMTRWSRKKGAANSEYSIPSRRLGNNLKT